MGQSKELRMVGTWALPTVLQMVHLWVVRMVESSDIRLVGLLAVRTALGMERMKAKMLVDRMADRSEIHLVARLD